jgi:hypothetical protein
MKREPLKTTERKIRQRAFLRHFRKLKNVALAAHRVGTSRTEVYRWSRKYPDFKQAFDEEVEAMLDGVERSLLAMATGEVTRPLVSAGKHVADERLYSEKAALAILAAYRQRWQERSTLGVNVSGSVEQNVRVTKREVTVQMVADVTRILQEAGVTFGAPHPENEHELTAIEDFKSRRVMKLLEPPPTLETEA